MEGSLLAYLPFSSPSRHVTQEKTRVQGGGGGNCSEKERERERKRERKEGGEKKKKKASFLAIPGSSFTLF